MLLMDCAVFDVTILVWGISVACVTPSGQYYEANYLW